MTHRFRIGLALLALYVAIPRGTAHADEPRAVDATVYQFEDDFVGGDTLSPDAEILQVRTRGRRQSLVRAREHFIKELLTSVEQL